MDIRLHEVPHVGIALEIGFKSGSSDKLCLVHGPAYEACDVGERDAPLTESQIHHFVGRIDDAGHVASLAYGLIGEAQAAEAVGVWLLEGEVFEFEEVEAVA